MVYCASSLHLYCHCSAETGELWLLVNGLPIVLWFHELSVEPNVSIYFKGTGMK